MPHTPEPWEQFGYIIYSPDNGIVCELSEPHPKDGQIRHHPVEFGLANRDEIQANGNLILASPGLLKVCERIDEYWSSGNFSRDEELWNQLRVEIAKAGGKIRS